MAIHVALNHQTTYRFDRPVALSPHVFRLRPAVHCRTPVVSYSLNITPENHFINWQQDPFGNFLARVVFPEKTRALTVEVDLVARMTIINPFDFFVEDYAEHYPFDYEPELRQGLLPYLDIRESGALLNRWLGSCTGKGRNTVDYLVDLNRRLQGDIGYTIRMEAGIQSCEETLAKGSGSCRDSAWLLVQVCRHLGLAARFVSGYLVQLAPDEKSLDGPSGPEKDFTDLHAWTEVYVPGAGWIGLDPTSGLFAGEGHLPLACTPDPAAAAPVTGATDPCRSELSFRNSVQRIHEDPRVTKPYSDEQWRAIDALGRKVEADLRAGDVRLTMGGEPTFVSIDDMDGAEWTTEADGKTKRRLAEELVRRLHRAFGAGGFLHFGQGKWYPGEPLPRWSLSCYWRSDGRPVWNDPRLFAAMDGPGGADPAGAERFLRELGRRIGVGDRFVIPGFEDAFYLLWSEARLPLDVDPLAADLEDPAERRKLARLLEGDPGAPVGYALPFGWDFDSEGWTTGPWRFRRPEMYLIPGNSPMGMRLPLDALAASETHQEDPFPERSPMGPFPELEDSPEAIDHRSRTDASSDAQAAPAPRTALCVEPRDGRLHVFLPPTSHLEHYLHLVAAVEDTAATLGETVILEGYPPPSDPRLRCIKVTPDPGVIEVNIHPARDWEDLVANTVTLYREARLSRLGTEKFMIDGRHTGTGGGNHVTIGGPTPPDSPVLRRPDLLRSLITYWQHHPGLSYLFSGLFIGPTSQAPRIDEGRADHLYELEIAFRQIPEGETPPPWLVDRLLRNLLVDLTGNTHRTEFCIDKLYSPDTLSGQQGLVEFRGFEMPPHARMSLVQMLLLRTLIARFWKRPYGRDLVRWGTELYDRWMLPHFIAMDIREVVDDIRRAGYDFEASWLDPFFEFRFPVYGERRIGGIRIELRMAIEPWHVLGEEVVRSGTARFVDSSVERLQVRIEGLTDTRYLLLCNGRRLPMRSTGTNGERVAGVRYRAWQPSSALHPTLGVDSPLVFDLYDTWNGRSIGGCTYHVMHPGGRNYETFPVNALEAESRRITRFWDHGHTPSPAIRVPPQTPAGARFVPTGSPPGPMAVPDDEPSPEFPMTLDLRLANRRPEPRS